MNIKLPLHGLLNLVLGLRAHFSRSLLLLTMSVCLVPPVAGAEREEPRIVERGAHHNLVEAVALETNALHQVVSVTNRFTEIATGLNHWDGTDWRPTREEFTVEEDYATAWQGPHKVSLPGNLNQEGAVSFRLPGGALMRSHIYGLAYHDTATGQSVLLAQLKDSQGWKTSPNQLAYPDAFDDVLADVRYTYRQGSFAQDVIVREQLPPPEKFGFNPATTRLEVWTEFVETPEPAKTRVSVSEAPRAGTTEDELQEDEQLDFGSMQIGTGRTFTVERAEDSLGLVVKRWLPVEGRRFLVETVALPEIAAGLEPLPPPRSQGASLRKPASGRLQAILAAVPPPKLQAALPKAKVLDATQNEPLIAAVNRPGVVVDYDIYGSLNNQTFESGKTYLVTALATLGGTMTTFQPGTVIKYSPGVSARLVVNTPVTWLGQPYRPVVLTARDDHSIGTKIGTASLGGGYYALTALEFTHSSALVLTNLRVTKAQNAIVVTGGSSRTIRHAQFVGCNVALKPTSTSVQLQNALLAGNYTAFQGASATVYGENVTIAGGYSVNGGGTVYLTNAIVSGVTVTSGISSGNPSSNAINPTGTVFQTVGAGQYYLPSGSAHRDTGTPGINTYLAAELKHTTTYAPTIRTDTVTVDTQLGLTATRDTNTPDRGYHYWPVDYAMKNFAVQDASLTLTGSPVIASFGSGVGTIRVLGNGFLCAEGTPNAPVRFARYNVVQEQPADWDGAMLSGSVTIYPITTGSLGLRFCHFYGETGPYGLWHIYQNWTDWYSRHLLVKDCLFFGSQLQLDGGRVFPDGQRTDFLNNALFKVFVYASLDSTADYVVNFYNNYLSGGDVLLDLPAGNQFTVRDNVFHGLDAFEAQPIGPLYMDHNAFVAMNTNYVHPGPNTTTGGDIVLSSYNFTTATVGSHTGTLYQSAANFIDKGSRTAAAAGLSQHTTSAAQAKDSGTAVDLGFHYVALYTSGGSVGLPVDSNSNGTPDYKEGSLNPGNCFCEGTLPALTVTLSKPVNNQVIATSPNNVEFEATLSGATSSVGKMEYFWGATLIGATDQAANNWHVNWDNITSGTYSGLKARALDCDCNRTVDSPTVSVTLNAMPSVTILLPANGATIAPGTPSTTVQFKIQASDTDGTIQTVRLYKNLDPTPVATATYSGGYYWVNLSGASGLPLGNYTYYARATDNQNAFVDSAIVRFRINDFSSLPSNVTLTAPINGSSVLLDSTVDLRASVTAPNYNSIAAVEFYDGSVKLGEDATFPYSLTTKFTTAGDHTLTAKVRTTAAKKQASSPVEISVAIPPSDVPGGFWETSAIGGTLLNWPFVQFHEIQKGDDSKLYAASTASPSNPPNTGAASKLESEDWAGILDAGSGSRPAAAYVIRRLPHGIVCPPSWLATGLGENWTYMDADVGLFAWRSREFGSDVLIVGGKDFAGVPNRYAGRFRWNTETFEPYGPTFNGSVRAILVEADTVYLGGEFTQANGLSGLQYLIRWTPTGGWEGLGSGLNGPVWALARFQGKLAVGGEFTQAGSVSSANRLALFDGSTWSGFESGVSGLPDEATLNPGVNTPPPDPAVLALKVRGNRLFVGGRFAQANNREGAVKSTNIVEAVWLPAQGRWLWKEMDQGVSDPQDSNPVYVKDIEIVDGATAEQFDVVVAGRFRQAGKRSAMGIARWRVGNQDSIDGLPTVTLEQPMNQQVIATSVLLAASATASGPGWSISGVEFYANGTKIGDGTEDSYDHKWRYIWNNPPTGVHQIWAVATQTDSTSIRINSTLRGWLRVESLAPQCQDDVYTINGNVPFTMLDVLANDTYTPQGGPWTITKVTRLGGALPGGGNVAGAQGNVSVSADGKRLTYRPYPGAYGLDVFYYETKNSSGQTGRAAVEVTVRSLPRVTLTSPADDFHTSSSSVTFAGSATDKDGTVSSIVLKRNGTQVGSISGSTFSQSVSLPSAGWYVLEAVATDNHGLTGTSHVTVWRTKTGSDTVPVAAITSLANSTKTESTFTITDYPVVRDAVMTLSGSAYDSDIGDPVSYSILLFRPDEPDKPVANLTPGTLDGDGFVSGSVNNGTLGTLNFARIPNGVYDLTLVVRGGDDQIETSVRISIENELKLGQFTFSEQDAVIPVNGIPLTLVRTYDSFNPDSRDFGYGWTYALADMDVRIDEEREYLTPFMSLSGSDANDLSLTPVSVRSGGGYNVTLTLPGGERTTFVFTPRRSAATQLMYAEWSAAPGVTATLEIAPADGNNTINFFSNGLGNPVWGGGDVHTPFERYDIPKMTLTTLDGTKYRLERTPSDANAAYYYIDEGGGNYVPVQPRSGQMHLVAIEQPTGDKIVISTTGISHTPANSASATRTLTFVRDDENRIIEVRDPKNVTGPALVKYGYDELTGNLVQVQRLISGTPTPTYATTRYYYEHLQFPHFITHIEDPRGVQVARTTYDEQGRIASITDSTGRVTTYAYPTSGFADSRTKARINITDHEGNVTVTESDGYGNVIYTKDASLAERWLTYDTSVGGIPTRLLQEQMLIRAPAGSGLSAKNLFRDVNYTDPANPTLPTHLTDWHPSGAGPLRTRKLEYNSRGQVTRQTEPLYSGGTSVFTELEYDEGNYGTKEPTRQLFTGTNPSATDQVLSQNVYYPLNGTAGQAGRLNYSLDAVNTATIYEYATSALTGSYRIGDLLSVTVKENGVGGTFLSKTAYTYDDNGNVKTEKQLNSTGGVLRTTTHEYDAQNRRVRTTDAAGGVNEQKFNVAGQAAQSIDRYGQSTYTFYDRRGRAACTRYPDGTYSFSGTHYSGTQRIEVRTDRSGTANSSGGTWTLLTGSRTIFDGVGRAVRTERLKNISLTESTAGNIQNPSPGPGFFDQVCDITITSTAPPNSDIFQSVLTAYYDDGRVWKTTEQRDLSTTADDQVTTYEYSEDGLVRTVRPPNYTEGGQTVSTEIIETSDLNGNPIYSQTKGYVAGVLQTFRPQTRFYYDQLNRRVRTRVADNEAVADLRNGSDSSSHGTLMSSTAYDWAGRRTSEIDADNNQTVFGYDGASRLNQVILGNGTSDTTTTGYGYDVLGQQITQTDANNRVTSFAYDALGRRVKRTLPNGSIERRRWEVAGSSGGLIHREFNVDFDGRVIFTNYDSMGRVVSKQTLDRAVLSGGTVSAPAIGYYNPTGANNALKFTASANGTSHNGLTVVFHADASVSGNTAYASYDAYSQILVVRYNSASTTAATVRTAVNGVSSPPVNAALDTVAEAGNTGAGTIGAGSSGAAWTTFAYSPTGQRSQMVDNITGTSRTIKYAYDEVGRLKVKQAPEGTLSYMYDAAGDLTQVSARHSYSFTGTTQWLFASGQQTQNARTAGAHMSYQYDARHRLSKVYSDPSPVGANLRATYSYDPVGNLAKTIYGDSGGTPVATTTYTYNPRNQLRYLKTMPNALTTGTPLASFDYDDFDTADGSGGSDMVWPGARKLATSGQRRGVREVLPAAGAAYPRLVGYAYDPLRRLTRESLFTGAFASETGYVQYDGTAGYGDTAGFDKVGNRRGRTASTFAGVTTRTYAPYDTNDRLGNTANPVSDQVSVRFDNNGNTLQFDLDASGGANWNQGDQGTASDSYDIENRLTGATRAAGAITLTYDGDGNRVKKTVNGVTTFYLVDDRNPTGYAQVLEEQPTAGGNPTVRYVHGLDLVNQDRGGTLHYFGYDGLGSVRFLLTSAVSPPVVSATYTYDAFGLQTASTGSTPNSYRYTGEQWDADLGMYYLRARYYHPDLGRFWNMDSFEGSQHDPLSLHKYLYAHNNPVNGVDPSGHEFSLAGLNVSQAISGGLQALRGVTLPAAGKYVARRIGNAFIIGTAGGVVGGFDSLGGGGEFLDGVLPGFKAGFVIGLIPPQAWATSGGKLMLKALAITGLLGAAESLEEGHPWQAALRAATSGAFGQLAPKTPKKLYHYFSSDKLAGIEAEGLKTGTAGKVWVSDMPPEEFNSIRLGGETGIIKDFPFLKFFTKHFSHVAVIDDPAGFEPAALTYKQLLGQYESSQGIPRGKIKIESLSGAK